MAMTLDSIIKEAFSLSKKTRLRESDGPGKLPEWDSLGHLNLLSTLEKEYAITFALDEMVAIETIADLKKLLKNKGVKGFA